MKIGDYTGIKAVHTLDPVQSLLGELATAAAYCQFLDSLVAEFSDADLLAPPQSVGFGEASKLVHVEREILAIAHEWHKTKANLNVQVVKLGLKSRQLEQAREQAQLVFGLMQAVLTNVDMPSGVRTAIRVELANRLRDLSGSAPELVAVG